MEQLAEKIGASRQSVGQWERGQHRPNGVTRRMLALALGVAPSTVDSWFPADRVAA